MAYLIFAVKPRAIQEILGLGFHNWQLTESHIAWDGGTEASGFDTSFFEWHGTPLLTVVALLRNFRHQEDDDDLLSVRHRPTTKKVDTTQRETPLAIEYGMNTATKVQLPWKTHLTYGPSAMAFSETKVNILSLRVLYISKQNSTVATGDFQIYVFDQW